MLVYVSTLVFHYYMILSFLGSEVMAVARIKYCLYYISVSRAVT